jgi:dTDP-glucose pyrophosphorylase/predicted transcriptional regulator
LSKYRDRLQIIADILSVVREGAKKTQVMYQANLSYRLLCRYLKEVSDAGLVSFESGDTYVLTDKGKSFLDRYEEYAKRCQNLEVQLNGANGMRNSLEGLCSNGLADSRLSFSNGRMPRVKTVPQFTPMKGVILAAGEGHRIRKVTYGAFPKELLPIGSVPTIRFPIEAIKLAGIKDIMIVIAPQTKHGIIDGLQSGEKLGVKISYVVQEKNEKGITGLGPAILSARTWIRQGEDFIVACGDSIVCDFSSDNPLDCLRPLVEVHTSNGAIATALVHPTNFDPTRFGVVKFQRLYEKGGVLYGELERLTEKPRLKLAESYKFNGYNYVLAGYYVFKPDIFSYIEKTSPGVKNEVQITDAMQLALENGEKVCAVVHARNKGKVVLPCDYWDVGIPEDYKEANKRLMDANLEQLIGSREYK